MYGSILDVVVVIIIVSNLYTNWHRGLVLSFIQICGFIAAIFITREFYKPFSTLLVENVTWVANFKETLQLKIDNVFMEQSVAVKEEMIRSIENGQFLDHLELPQYLERSFNQYLYDLNLSQVADLNSTIANILIQSIMGLLSFVTLFILILLVIKIVGAIIDGIFKLPILRGINQFGGLIFGFILGNFYVFLLMAIITVFISLGVDIPMESSLESSEVAKYYYHNNVLLMLINYYL